MSEKRDRLKQIIREKSFGEGVEITLASGRVSDFYFNMKPTMLDPEGAHLMAELILDAVRDYDAGFIGGLEMGAVPIASAVAPASFKRGQPLRAFIVRKQAKGHGTQKLIEGLKKDETISGHKVILVEDVTTTGGSAIQAAEILREAGAEILCVLTLVDRQEGADAAFKEAGLEVMALFKAEEFRSKK